MLQHYIRPRFRPLVPSSHSSSGPCRIPCHAHTKSQAKSVGSPAPSAAACARAGVGSRDFGVADGGGKSWADVGESWANAADGWVPAAHDADGLDMAGTGPRRIVALSGIAMYLRARADQSDEPSPGADVAGVSPVPIQMWQGVSPVPMQMWQG
jgi:hypothetical protein